MALMAELTETVRSGSASGVHSLVIAGNDKAFSSGAISKKRPDRRLRGSQAWGVSPKRWRARPLPIIAAIDGFCFTGGLGSLACDIGSRARAPPSPSPAPGWDRCQGLAATQRLPRTMRALGVLSRADRAIHKGRGKDERCCPALALLYAERAPLTVGPCQGMETDSRAACCFRDSWAPS